MSFKAILITLFIGFAVVGIGLFALQGKSGGGGQGAQSEVLIWGTKPAEFLSTLFKRVNEETVDRLRYRYVEIEAEAFEAELLEAIASGVGPDMILLPDDLIIKHKNKITAIPYESYSVGDFRSAFVEGAEVFLDDTGILALPFYLDPLVLYWNRDIFSNAGVASPPETWQGVLSTVPTFTQKDSNFNITRSAIALGEYENITNSKEILYAMLLQVDNMIVETSDGRYVSALQGLRRNGSATVSALDFYTGFSDPSNESYSWNRSLPFSKDAFLAGDLAMYVGFASEASDIRRRNPNLNFDVVVLPQLQDAVSLKTFAHLEGLAVLRSSRFSSDAFLTAYELTSDDILSKWSEVTLLPPVSRRLLNERPANAFGPVFYESALISRGVIDPDPLSTRAIFGEMIGSITSGRQSISDALRLADDKMRLMLGN